MNGTCTLDIAGLHILLTSQGPDLPITVDGTASKFTTAPVPPDVRIHTIWGDTDEADPGELIFDPGKNLWRLFRRPGGYRFLFTSPLLGERPYQVATFNDAFSEGEVRLRREVFQDRLPLYPLQYPLDELLLVHLLSHGRGIEIHASGLVDAKGAGHLFAGQSGAGKTTMARLWLAARNSTILSDERIILRKEGETIWMYGTPWHGEGQIANPGRAPLRRIFFLRHGQHNALSPQRQADAAARLFACSFTPFHSAQGLEYSLELLDDIARLCRCEELTFVPDARAVAFVEGS